MLKRKYFSYVRFFNIIRFLVDVPQRQRFQPDPPLPKQLLDFDEDKGPEDDYSVQDEGEDPEEADGSDTQYVADK